MKIVRKVSYLQGSYQDARSTKHKAPFYTPNHPKYTRNHPVYAPNHTTNTRNHPVYTSTHPIYSKSLWTYSESPYIYSKSPCIHSEKPDTEKSGTSARHARSTDFPSPTHNELHTAGHLLEKLTGPQLFTNFPNFMQPVSSLLRS